MSERPNPGSLTLALVVATRNRLECLRPRVPIWAEAGFDEVIVVNTPDNPNTAAAIRELCSTHGVRYVETERTLRDLRSRARNLGARVATTTWVLFSDDDVAAIAELNRAAFEHVVDGRDWLAGPSGDIVVLHRRASFLAFGGYPEDMVASEDTIMSIRARRHGRGGCEGEIAAKVVEFDEPPRVVPIDRARSYFWYSVTLPLFFLRTPKFREAVASDAHRTLRLGMGVISGDVKCLVYLLCYAFGRLLSPFHVASVLIRSGWHGITREPEASWGEAR